MEEGENRAFLGLSKSAWIQKRAFEDVRVMGLEKRRGNS